MELYRVELHEPAEVGDMIIPHGVLMRIVAESVEKATELALCTRRGYVIDAVTPLHVVDAIQGRPPEERVQAYWPGWQDLPKPEELVRHITPEMMGTEAGAQKALRQAYCDGYQKGLKVGLRRYAWWKDGVQYVGAGVTTLAEALNEAEGETPDFPPACDTITPGGHGVKPPEDMKSTGHAEIVRLRAENKKLKRRVQWLQNLADGQADLLRPAQDRRNRNAEAMAKEVEIDDAEEAVAAILPPLELKILRVAEENAKLQQALNDKTEIVRDLCNESREQRARIKALQFGIKDQIAARWRAYREGVEAGMGRCSYINQQTQTPWVDLTERPMELTDALGLFRAEELHLDFVPGTEDGILVEVDMPGGKPQGVTEPKVEEPAQTTGSGIDEAARHLSGLLHGEGVDKHTFYCGCIVRHLKGSWAWEPCVMHGTAPDLLLHLGESLGYVRWVMDKMKAVDPEGVEAGTNDVWNKARALHEAGAAAVAKATPCPPSAEELHEAEGGLNGP